MSDPRTWRDCEHGDRCDCMLLARAVGVGPDAIDLSYCRQVLQKHWALRCNHGNRAPPPKRTRELPQHDPSDPVQVVLVSNA